MELRVGGKYRLSRKLGCGAFGDIYHGKYSGSPLSTQFLTCFDWAAFRNEHSHERGSCN